MTMMTRRPFGLAAAAVAVAWLAAPAIAADTFQVDPVHSSVVFRVKHMNASNAWGRFNDISGSFSLDDQDPGKSRLEFQVKAASIDTGQAKRDQHLQGPDFFNAVQFPTIAFRGKSVASAGPGAFEVAGDLTLHGVTRPITVKVTRTGAGKNPMGKAVVGIESSFLIKRSEFGMNKMVGPVGDDVWVNVSIEAGKS